MRAGSSRPHNRPSANASLQSTCGEGAGEADGGLAGQGFEGYTQSLGFSGKWWEPRFGRVTLKGVCESAAASYLLSMMAWPPLKPVPLNTSRGSMGASS